MTPTYGPLFAALVLFGAATIAGFLLAGAWYFVARGIRRARALAWLAPRSDSHPTT